jgi:hypothetical protein
MGHCTAAVTHGRQNDYVSGLSSFRRDRVCKATWRGEAEDCPVRDVREIDATAGWWLVHSRILSPHSSLHESTFTFNIQQSSSCDKQYIGLVERRGLLFLITLHCRVPEAYQQCSNVLPYVKLASATCAHGA